MDNSKVAGKLVLITALTVLAALGGFRGAEAAVACNEVVKNLMPCVSYVVNGGNVTQGCCTGVKTLFGEAKTGGDRRDVCNCIKKTINGISYTRKNLQLAAELPKKCGVNIPYKISPSTNCASVN